MQIPYAPLNDIQAPAGRLTFGLPAAPTAWGIVLREKVMRRGPDRCCSPSRLQTDANDSDTFSAHLTPPGKPGLKALGLVTLPPGVSANRWRVLTPSASCLPPHGGDSWGRARHDIKWVYQFQKALLVSQLCEGLGGCDCFHLEHVESLREATRRAGTCWGGGPLKRQTPDSHAWFSEVSGA